MLDLQCGNTAWVGRDDRDQCCQFHGSTSVSRPWMSDVLRPCCRCTAPTTTVRNPGSPWTRMFRRPWKRWTQRRGCVPSGWTEWSDGETRARRPGLTRDGLTGRPSRAGRQFQRGGIREGPRRTTRKNGRRGRRGPGRSAAASWGRRWPSGAVQQRSSWNHASRTRQHSRRGTCLDVVPRRRLAMEPECRRTRGRGHAGCGHRSPARCLGMRAARRCCALRPRRARRWRRGRAARAPRTRPPVIRRRLGPPSTRPARRIASR